MREGTPLALEYTPPDEATYKFHTSSSRPRVLEGARGAGTTVSVLVELFLEASRKSRVSSPVVLAICTKDEPKAAALLELVRGMGVPLEKREEDKYYTSDLRGTKIQLYFAINSKRLQGLNLDGIAIDGVDSKDEVDEWIDAAYRSRQTEGEVDVLVASRSWDLPLFEKPQPLLKSKGVWRPNPKFRGANVPGALQAWIDRKRGEGEEVEAVPRINFNLMSPPPEEEEEEEQEWDSFTVDECGSVELYHRDTDASSGDVDG